VLLRNFPPLVLAYRCEFFGIITFGIPPVPLEGGRGVLITVLIKPHVVEDDRFPSWEGQGWVKKIRNCFGLQYPPLTPPRMGIWPLRGRNPYL
jgi:hypothetical protein